MTKIALVMLACLLLLGCGKKVPESKPIVFTETWEHEPLTMQEPTPTGDRGDIPAGVSAADVVSQETFSHAGGKIARITTVKEGKGIFKKPKKEVYSNCVNCHGPGKDAPAVSLKVETPEAPWWKIPVYLACGGFILFILFKLFPVLGLLRRFIPWGK